MFVAAAKKHEGLTELTHEALWDLVEKVVVHEKQREPGIGSRGREVVKIKQKVEIYFKYVGIIE